MKWTLILLLALFSSGQFNTVDELFSDSKNKEKPVLLLFSGSDWCHNCIKMHENIIKNQSFEEQIVSKTLFYQADFPQKNKQEKSVIKFNESLADIFNPKGVFPLLLLIDSDKNVLLQTTYQSSEPSYYINLFSPKLSDSE